MDKKSVRNKIATASVLLWLLQLEPGLVPSTPALVGGYTLLYLLLCP